MLTLQSGESDQESVYGTEQQRLREESRAYRLKLQAYQDSQQKQAQLVHKLQAKVHQALLIFILTLHLQQIHPHCILSYLERNSVHCCVYYYCVVVTLQVLQYKKRSGDLEQQVLEKTSELEKLRLTVWHVKAPTFSSSCTFHFCCTVQFVLVYFLWTCMFLCVYM